MLSKMATAVHRLRHEMGMSAEISSEDGFFYLRRDDTNSLGFSGYVRGPSGTPYEDGRFKVWVQVPENYPYEPPQIWFTTKVCHPNVAEDGLVSMNILTDDWSGALSLHPVMMSVVALLDEPDFSCVFNSHVKRLQSLPKEMYQDTVRYFTYAFAMDKEQQAKAKTVPKMASLVDKVEQLSDTFDLNKANAAHVLALFKWDKDEATEFLVSEPDFRGQNWNTHFGYVDNNVLKLNNDAFKGLEVIKFLVSGDSAPSIHETRKALQRFAATQANPASGMSERARLTAAIGTQAIERGLRDIQLDGGAEGNKDSVIRRAKSFDNLSGASSPKGLCAARGAQGKASEKEAGAKPVGDTVDGDKAKGDATAAVSIDPSKGDDRRPGAEGDSIDGAHSSSTTPQPAADEEPENDVWSEDFVMIKHNEDDFEFVMMPEDADIEG